MSALNFILELTNNFPHVSILKKPQDTIGDKDVINRFIALTKEGPLIPARFAYIALGDGRAGEKSFYAQAVCDSATTAAIKELVHNVLHKKGGKFKDSAMTLGMTIHTLGNEYHMSLNAFPDLLSPEDTQEFLTLLTKENTVFQYSIGGTADLDALLGKKKKKPQPEKQLLFTRQIFEKMSSSIQSDSLRERLKGIVENVLDQSFYLQKARHAKGWIAMPVGVKHQ